MFLFLFLLLLLVSLRRSCRRQGMHREERFEDEGDDERGGSIIQNGWRREKRDRTNTTRRTERGIKSECTNKMRSLSLAFLLQYSQSNPVRWLRHTSSVFVSLDTPPNLVSIQGLTSTNRLLPSPSPTTANACSPPLGMINPAPSASVSVSASDSTLTPCPSLCLRPLPPKVRSGFDPCESGTTPSG